MMMGAVSVLCTVEFPTLQHRPRIEKITLEAECKHGGLADACLCGALWQKEFRIYNGSSFPDITVTS